MLSYVFSVLFGLLIR